MSRKNHNGLRLVTEEDKSWLNWSASFDPTPQAALSVQALQAQLAHAQARMNELAHLCAKARRHSLWAFMAGTLLGFGSAIWIILFFRT